jgi:hypothetical protein
MANELQRPDSASNAHAGAGSGHQPDREPKENDPETWLGLIWRIVRTASQSNANLIRVSVLILIAGGVLWVIASVR